MPRLCAASVRMRRVDQRQSDERPPSSGQHVSTGRRSSRTSEVMLSTIGPCRDPAAPDLEQLESNVAGVPQPGRARREQLLGQLNDPPDQSHGPLTECHLRPPRRAKQVGDQPEIRPITLVNRSAGPPAAMTRRWISATSSRGSTGASTVTRSFVATEVIDEGSKVGK